MAPSNALSSRRSYLRRPKVCHETPNPGRCHPPPPPPPPLPPRTCDLSPEHFEIEVGDGDSVDFSACCPELPLAEGINYEYSALFGSVDPGDQNTDNCDATDNLQYGAPDFECEDVITVVATWSDGGKCTAKAYATVVEEDNGNDE